MFGIGLEQKLFQSHKNIYFKVNQNGIKSNQAWKEFSQQILVAENCKSCEIYKRMYDIYGEVYFSSNNVYKWVKHRVVNTSLNKKK